MILSCLCITRVPTVDFCIEKPSIKACARRPPPPTCMCATEKTELAEPITERKPLTRMASSFSTCAMILSFAAIAAAHPSVPADSAMQPWDQEVKYYGTETNAAQILKVVKAFDQHYFEHGVEPSRSLFDGPHYHDTWAKLRMVGLAEVFHFCFATRCWQLCRFVVSSNIALTSPLMCSVFSVGSSPLVRDAKAGHIVQQQGQVLVHLRPYPCRNDPESWHVPQLEVSPHP